MNRYIANIPGVNPNLLRPVKNIRQVPALLPRRTLLTPSGTHALYLACRALGLKKGHRVLVPAFSCYSIVDPLVKTGAEPLFFNVDRRGSVDFSALERLMDRRVKALVWINFMGIPRGRGRAVRFCRRHRIFLVEDAAHGIPVKDKRPAGDVTVYSFRKIIPSLAGALVINNPKIKIPKTVFEKQYPDSYRKGLLAREAYHYQLFLQSQDPAREVKRLPYRYYADRIDEMHGDFTRFFPVDPVSLSVLHNVNPQTITRKRRRNFMIYLKRLKRLALFKTLPKGGCPLGFPVLVNGRDRLRRRLEREGVEALVHWDRSLLPKGVYRAFPDAAWLTDHVLTLPCHHDLEFPDVRYVCSCVRDMI